jgi:seryl-tRNA synthetase
LVSIQEEWKELVSASNCTDYQTRELEVRYKAPVKKGAKGMEAEAEVGKKQCVHALNAVSLTSSQLRMIEREEANTLGMIDALLHL